MKNKRIEILPLIIVLMYSFFTILLFYSCPWNWKVDNNITLLLFLIFANLSLFLGYMTAKRRYNKGKKKVGKINLTKYRKVFTFFIIFYCIILFIGLIIDYKLTPYNFIDKIISSFLNPGEAYYNYSQSTSLVNKIIIWGQVLLAPLFYMIIPLCIYYFDHLDKKEKSCFFLIIVFELLKWVLKGTNKGIIDLILLMSVFYILKIFKKTDFNLKSIFNKYKKIIFTLLLCMIIGVIYFVYNISTRVDMSNQIHSLGSIMNNTTTKDSIFDCLPNVLYTLILILSSYLCQGYYGLSLCLKLPFQSTYGIGFSSFLTANFSEILGIDITSRTYAYRAQSFGWNPTVNWHSMYTWFANDVSFYGVIIIMFLIGYLFAYVWISYIYEDNVFALPFLGLFTTMFIYISANNQVFNFPTSFMSFFGILIIWWGYRIISIKRSSEKA